MLKKALYLVPLGVAALAAGAWFAHTRYAPEPPVAPAIATFWQQEFPDLRGKPQRLAQWRGRILVVNFWASWCAPCREEMPDLVDLHRKYNGNGVEFVGIAVDSAANVSTFLRTVPVAYPVLLGGGAGHTLARQLGNPAGALPYTVVFSREGGVVLTHLGRLPREKLENALRRNGA
jgi:thiol-disulfide isomerase/thioredoxin